VLILEDDVLLMPHFETRLERLWHSTHALYKNRSSSSKLHLFTMLGFMSNGIPHREIIVSFPTADFGGRGVTDSLVLPSQTIGFFGYAVTAEAAAGTLRAILPLRQAIDSALHHSFTALAANNVQAWCPSVPSAICSQVYCNFFICFPISFALWQVAAFDARTRLEALDRTHYTGILSYEPRFKSDIPRLKGQPHSDPARPVIAITHPRNGSTVDADSVLNLELILLNIMEGETLLRVAVNEERVVEMGVPNLNSRNFISITTPPPPSAWFDVEISLVSTLVSNP
jgi:hypothetical protein